MAAMTAESAYGAVCEELRHRPRRWLVTGAAGFIGSHLVEHLLVLGQWVRGLDNFSTGSEQNLMLVGEKVGPDAWRRFELVTGDIRDCATCLAACANMDVVLHQAALGSVPRSVKEPQLYWDVNATGFLNMLEAARTVGVRRLVYASSSSVYGDATDLPKREAQIGQPLSPYALSKRVNEMAAQVFQRCYGLETIGLRYFNVFGPRQDPHGAYSAVIPRWIKALLTGAPVQVFGDGSSSRDFCYVENVVQANLLAGVVHNVAAPHQVFNIAVGERTDLLTLHRTLCELLGVCEIADQRGPQFLPGREQDIAHSHADISRAMAVLGYRPSHTLRQGLALALPWYRAISAMRGQVSVKRHAPRAARP